MEMIKLNDICDVRDGTHDSPQYVTEGYPLVTSKNIIDGQIDITNVSYISEEDYEAINKRSNVDHGDILMPMIGTIGKPIIVNKEFEFAIKNVALIKFYEDSKVMPAYIRYVLDSNLFNRYVEKENRGGTQKFISLGNIRNFPVPVVSLEKQKEITSILNKLSQIIKSRKLQMELLDNLVKSRFVEMFGEPTSNTKRLKTFPMTEVCEIIDGDRGKNYPNQDEFFKDEFCLFLNAKNVTSTGFSFSDTMFISKEKDELLRKGKLQRGDVVLTTRGTIGNLAYYADEVPFDNMRINSGMVILRMKKSLVEERFFIQQFRMQLEDIKNKIASGSAQPQLPISTMNKINILIPNIEEQNQFATFVQHTDKLKFEVKKSLDETQLLFDSLMQIYFE